MLAATLTLSTALLSTQITISEVTAEREGGRVAITVKGDAMIDPEAASAKFSDGRLYLFVRDARVHEANRAWRNGAVEEGGEEIRAHRHKQKIELAVPLGDDGCQGPVEFETMAGGLRAVVGCDGAPRPGVARVARQPAPKAEAQKAEDAQDAVGDDGEAAPTPQRDRRSPAPVPAALSPPAVMPAPALARGETESALRGQPRVEAKTAAPIPAPRLSAHDAAALKAMLSPEAAPPVQLGPPDPKPEPKTATAAAAAGKTGGAARAAALPRVLAGARASTFAGPAASLIGPNAAAPVAPPLGEAPTGAAAARAGGTEAHDKVGAAGGGGLGGGVVLAGCVLLAIAGCAFFFSRRRSIGGRRHIQILETASLGPKRALIVARVGDATLILGSSEAGITLLQSVPDAALKSDRPNGALTDAGVALAAVAAAARAVASEMPANLPVPALGELETKSDPGEARLGRAERAPGSSSVPIDVEDRAEAPASQAPATSSTPTAAMPVAPANDESRSGGQAGLLSRLFRRGTPANDSSTPRFEDFLEDSFEDQELRRKLALGLPGRVR